MDHATRLALECTEKQREIFALHDEVGHALAQADHIDGLHGVIDALTNDDNNP